MSADRKVMAGVAGRRYPRGHNTERAIAGSLNAPLHAWQKKALVAAARTAYDKKGGRETGQSFEEFRREQQVQACGIESLRLAQQKHFKLLRGHFDNLTGRKVSALRQFVGAEGPGQARELALAKLRHEAEELSEPKLTGSPFDSPAAAMQYAQGILFQAKAGSLETAEPKAIWNAFFGLKRWVQRKRWYPAREEQESKIGERRSEIGKPRQAQGSGKTRQDSILAGGGQNPPIDPAKTAGRAQNVSQTTAEGSP